MTEVRISSLCERPCAGIEETGEAPSDAGGMECSRRSKVHSLIDKVYDPANLAEAWKRVRENKGSAGIDGLTVAGFEGSDPQLDAATSAGEAAGHDRGDKPDHPRLGELLPESKCPKAVP